MLLVQLQGGVDVSVAAIDVAQTAAGARLRLFVLRLERQLQLLLVTSLSALQVVEAPGSVADGCVSASLQLFVLHLLPQGEDVIVVDDRLCARG